MNRTTLVQTGDEVVHHIAQDHLTALRHIHQFAAHQAQQDGQGDGQEHGKHHAGDAPDLPVGDEDQGDLSGHGPQGHAEVQAHARHNGDEQAQDQKNVPAHTVDDLINQIAGGKVGQRVADHADDNEHQRNQIVLQEVETVKILFHLHFAPSVFLVRA